MNNLLSYCGLIDAKIKASDKDLPVLSIDTLTDNETTFQRDNLVTYSMWHFFHHKRALKTKFTAKS